MAKKKSGSTSTPPGAFDQARDELFSHILRCGVLEATEEHKREWFDDTMQYLEERYTNLADEHLATLRTLGERYCEPVVQRNPAAVGSPND